MATGTIHDELLLHVPGALCGDPCPQAPDLLPCLLVRDHYGDWHENRSSRWPTDAWRDKRCAPLAKLGEDAP